jgi:hypothetical protein
VGTEHYIVDLEGKNVLHVHKWYGISLVVREDDYDFDPIGGVPTSIERVREATSLHPYRGGSWVGRRAEAWIDKVTGGRPLRLFLDDRDYQEPWLESWDQYDGSIHDYPQVLPGWTYYSAFELFPDEAGIEWKEGGEPGDGQ